MGLFGMDDGKTLKIEAHVRLEGALAKMVKERAANGNRPIIAEIRRALRVAYKLGASDA